MGPTWEIAASCALKLHCVMGRLLSRRRMSAPSTATMLVLRFRSLLFAHEPPPGASVTPAVAAPVLRSTADANWAPPVDRTRNWLFAWLGKVRSSESDQTKDPRCMACPRRPPGTVENRPLAMLSAPPPTVDRLPEATFEAPPATVACAAPATVDWPP